MLPVFDIDLTLLKGSPVHDAAHNYAIRTVFGLPQASKHDIITDGKVDSQIITEVASLYGIAPEMAWSRMPEAITVMESYYREHEAEDHVELMPGVLEMLEELKAKGITMGVLTGNIEYIGRHKLEMAGIDQYFTFDSYSDEVRSRSELVPQALANAEKVAGRKLEYADLTIVGDTPKDVACGKEHDTHTIGVASGKFSREELEKTGADLVVGSFAEPEERKKVAESLMPAGINKESETANPGFMENGSPPV